MWRTKVNVTYSIHFSVRVTYDFPLRKKIAFNACYLITKIIQMNIILVKQLYHFFKEKASPTKKIERKLDQN